MERSDGCIHRLTGSWTLSRASKFLSHIKTWISFKILRRRRQRGRQKSDRFNIKNNNFSRALRFFVRTFLCCHCTTMTWKCLILRFTEEVHNRRRNFLTVSELGYGSYEFNFRRVHLHLTKSVTWSIKSQWRLKGREFTFSATFLLPSQSSDLKVRGMELRLLLEWNLA